MDRNSTSSDTSETTLNSGSTSDPPDAEGILRELHNLAEITNSNRVEEGVLETMDLVIEASKRGLIRPGVRKLTIRDVAQALVGSIVFASPLLVEDGIFDIAEYLFEFRVNGIPIFLIANTLFLVLMTYALLEWTGHDTEEENLILGVVPTRLMMVLGVSFIVAAILMTVWGRVGDWDPPIEAIARINVLWTVGSLGAAFGDVISGDTPAGSSYVVGDETRQLVDELREDKDMDLDLDKPVESVSDVVLLEELNDRLSILTTVTEGTKEPQEIRRDILRAQEDAVGPRFGEQIRKYTSRDIAEAFVGSVFFSIPLLVEDGVFDVANYFLAYRIGRFPIFFIFNAAFVIAMVWALVYWAGPQRVKVSRPLFGVIPRRMVGISVVSFLTAAALMTMWGRVVNWEDFVVAVARISAVWAVASFGAALGDILPGESSGDDINDELAGIGDRVENLVE